jgi:ABC-type amino acid transport substrate-binding protein
MAAKIVRPLLALVLFLVACTPGCAPPAVTAGAAQGAPSARSVAVAIHAGTSGNYPPLSVWSGGRPDGFAPLLLSAFADAQHAELAWTRFAWPELVGDLKRGRFDVAADGITVRPERSLVVRLSGKGARREEVGARVREDLADARLDAASVERLVDAIVALGGAERSGTGTGTWETRHALRDGSACSSRRSSSSAPLASPALLP